MSRSFKTPKGCSIRSIEQGSGSRAEIRYQCPTGDYQVKYESAFVTHSAEIRVPGTVVRGIGSRVDFVLAPRYVTCSKKASDNGISCKLHDGANTISGARRRRRR